MSLNSQQSRQTLQKALHWLEKQPGNWSELIKDSDVAVKMYLKSQNKSSINSKENWVKEVSPFLKPEPDKLDSIETQSFRKKEVFSLTKKDSPSNNSDISRKGQNSPPADWADLLPQKKTSTQKKAFFLDQVSLSALEKTKKELNLEKEEEALRLLIQLGQQSLKKLFP